jgi:hypothetical protein
MNESDLKLLLLNFFSFSVSMATVEVTLKVTLLLISIGYTAQRWYILYKEKNDK